MFKKRVLVTMFSCLLVFLLILLFVERDSTDNMVVKASLDKQVNTISDNSKNDTNTKDNDSKKSLANLDIVEAKKATTYDGMTVDELASKLNSFLKNELSGKGYLYASYSLEKGVDPYLAVAISLEETGCTWNCSRLVRECNNVGGMKGKGCGSYGSFATLDDGIRSFINNIYKNYVAYGLTNAELMNPKYAANPAWSTNVNAYINKIKNS